jgi:prepilin-type N-terminal cleavage/methylation domain-containing protein
MSRGLTLLEVIAAMTVLAVGIVAVLGAISACLRSSAAAAGYSRGVALAQQVAAEFERNAALEAGEFTGTFDDIATGYTWTAEVSSADANGLYPLHITVEWQAGTRQYELSTLLYPRALPTAATEQGAQQSDELPPALPEVVLPVEDGR